MAHFFKTTDPVTGETKVRKSREDYGYCQAVWFDTFGRREVSFTSRPDLAAARLRECGNGRRAVIAPVEYSDKKPKS